MESKKRTEISTLGQFGLIERLTRDFTPRNDSTRQGVGDDAAVLTPPAGEELLCTTDTLFEGVDFDLTYFPLKHLGYKVVTAALSDLAAMNATPSQLLVSLGVSASCPSRRSTTSMKGSVSPAGSRRSTSWAATRAPR